MKKTKHLTKKKVHCEDVASFPDWLFPVELDPFEDEYFKAKA